MVIVRIKEENYIESPIFSIDYKGLYDDVPGYDYLKEEKCVRDILNLASRNKKLIARFMERDKDLDDDKEKMCDDFLRDYHRGYQADFDGFFEKEIKSILLKYEKINNENIDNTDDIKDMIFKKFKNTPLGEMDKDMLNEIKEILYKKIYVCCLEDYNEDFQKFANERIFEITQNFWFPDNENLAGIDFDKSFTRDLWIALSLKDDLDYWSKNILGSDFEGVITDKDNVESYDYHVLYCTHDWIGDVELSVLTVLERNKGDFIKNVFPLLEKELGVEITPVSVEDINKRYI